MRVYSFLIVFFGLTLLLPAHMHGQSRAELEKQRKVIEQKIKEAQSILNETQKQKKTTVGQLNAINQKIKIQSELIDGIKTEISSLENEIQELESIIDGMLRDLEHLKKEYSSMLYATQKYRANENLLVFLFSSESFNQFFLRLKYMDFYSSARENQVTQIQNVTTALENQKTSIMARQSEKQELLEEEMDESLEMKGFINEQRKVVQSLSTKEQELKAELAKRKKASQKLDKMIEELVAAEIRRSSKGQSSSRMTLTPQARELSENFANNRTKLPWPVASGFISKKFGKQPHPALKGVFIENNGIDIQTRQDEVVRAVFPGKVTNIAIAPPPYHNTIIVQHGEYFTVYAKLKKVTVKAGDEIKLNDVIGEVFTDKDAVSEVHFEIWQNTKRLNPQSWLARK